MGEQTGVCELRIVTRQGEEYIREHSEAEFSHGLCPK